MLIIIQSAKIKLMKTVGEILKETRIKKGIDFERIEKVTKIRRKYLVALEKNDFAKIGQATTVKGFIKNYGEFLGLDSASLLAIFRRDFTEDKVGQVILRGMIEPLNQPRFTWNPKKTFIAAVILVFFFFLAFLGWHLLSLRLAR